MLMEYFYLMDLADKCEDPYMRLIYASDEPGIHLIQFLVKLMKWSIMEVLNSLQNSLLGPEIKPADTMSRASGLDNFGVVGLQRQIMKG
ncbi:unnamed protein product [Camellia sinensis]